MSVILNVAPDGATIAGSVSDIISAKIQFLDQVKVNSTSQLINSISKFLQSVLVE